MKWHTQPKCVSPLSIVTRSNGKQRLILDLAKLCLSVILFCICVCWHPEKTCRTLSRLCRALCRLFVSDLMEIFVAGRDQQKPNSQINWLKVTPHQNHALQERKQVPSYCIFIQFQVKLATLFIPIDPFLIFLVEEFYGTLYQSGSV